jgi:hypothetical protein
MPAASFDLDLRQDLGAKDKWEVALGSANGTVGGPISYADPASLLQLEAWYTGGDSKLVALNPPTTAGAGPKRTWSVSIPWPNKKGDYTFHVQGTYKVGDDVATRTKSLLLVITISAPFSIV